MPWYLLDVGAWPAISPLMLSVTLFISWKRLSALMAKLSSLSFNSCLRTILGPHVYINCILCIVYTCMYTIYEYKHIH